MLASRDQRSVERRSICRVLMAIMTFSQVWSGRRRGTKKAKASERKSRSKEKEAHLTRMEGKRTREKGKWAGEATSEGWLAIEATKGTFTKSLNERRDWKSKEGSRRGREN